MRALLQAIRDSSRLFRVKFFNFFMSGRLPTYRAGDRSEYLAIYFLSALGLVSPIPRQEDIGFDLLCSVQDPEEEFLTFRFQYLVSIKSKGRHGKITMRPPKNWDGAAGPHHIHWLFELDLPLVLALADQKAGTVALYSTDIAWWFRYQFYHECGMLTLKPRVGKQNAANVDAPKRLEELEKYPGMYHYEIDLGYPMFVLSHAVLQKKVQLEQLRERLRMVLTLSHRSLRYWKVGAPYFYWFAVTKPDCSEYVPAFWCHSMPTNPAIHESVMREIAPILCTLAMYYKAVGNMPVLHKIGEVLKLAPENAVEPVIKGHLNEIFVAQ